MTAAPTPNLSLLDFYKAIESTSALMLHAAQEEDWDEVVRLEGVCAVLIEQLRERAGGHELSLEEKTEKHRIMMTILRHDAQIRGLVEPWIDELGAQMHPAPAMQLH